GVDAGDREVDERQVRAVGERARSRERVVCELRRRGAVVHEQEVVLVPLGVDLAHPIIPRYASSSQSPAKSATPAPSARDGPNGIFIFRAALPWRANSTTDGSSAATVPIIIATGTVRPSAKPSSRASLTSPIPIPAG